MSVYPFAPFGGFGQLGEGGVVLHCKQCGRNMRFYSKAHVMAHVRKEHPTVYRQIVHGKR